MALAEELHFTRAAARVHLAQSSFSASIAALERELGEPLFVRDARRVALTPAGVVLLPAARRALAAAQEGHDAVTGSRGVLRGQLRVGTIQALGVLDLPALLARFHRAHPEVAIRVVHDAAPALADAAATGGIDVAFLDVPTDPARLRRLPLGSDDLTLAVPPGDPLTAQEAIRLDDAALRERGFVEYRADSGLRAQVDVACAAAGLARRVVAEVDTLHHLVECIRHGLGVAVLPLAALDPTDVVPAIAVTPTLSRDVAAVVAATHTPAPPTQALLALLDPEPLP